MNSLNCNGRFLSFDEPKVMGILNVTPDSFYDGGRHVAIDSAITKVTQMVEDGVSIVDVGGMSTRPGAKIIDVEEESKRVLPILDEINQTFPDLIISIDTIHGIVAQRAIDKGASLINDISGGTIDSSIWQVSKDNNVPYILMHIQGTPQTMQSNPQYEDVGLDILKYLRDRVATLRNFGINDIIIDPGFGFGKTVNQNYELLSKMSSFKILECPILVGLSRKGMIYKLLKTTSEKALNGTSAAHMIALQNGANILRVHDVKEAMECIKIHLQISKSN